MNHKRAFRFATIIALLGLGYGISTQAQSGPVTAIRCGWLIHPADG